MYNFIIVVVKVECKRGWDLKRKYFSFGMIVAVRFYIPQSVFVGWAHALVRYLLNWKHLILYVYF
jgi:hypothetical protein